MPDVNRNGMDWETTLTAEKIACSLLGKAFYAYPDKAWFQSLVDEDVFSEAPLGESQPDVQGGIALLQHWASSTGGTITDRMFDSLVEDYNHLFVGPQQLLAPPWESVFFSDERLAFQKEMLDVRAWYARFGLQSDKIFREPDDHIGLELAFVAHLAEFGLGAVEKNSQGELEEYIAAQRDFMREHLLRWAPGWTAQVEARARTEFYSGLARLTRGILAEIGDLLQVGPADGKV